MAMAGLKTRKPTGRVPWPCILLEGEEKSGKSWALAQFSSSDRIGTLYWIDLNEGAGDEYGAIPGATYELVEHAGTTRRIAQRFIAERFAESFGARIDASSASTPARRSGTGSRTGRAPGPRSPPATGSCSSATRTPRSPSARTCGTTPGPAGASCRPSCSPSRASSW